MNYGNDNKKAVQAKFDAQKIAFGPIMFQAAHVMLKLGILETLHKNRETGLTIPETASACNLPVYGVKVLLEAGISMEVVYVKESKFFLSKTGWFILNDPLTKVNFDFVHDVNYLGFHKLDKSITNKNPEGLKTFGSWDTVYEALSELPEHVQESWFAFDHYYSDNAFPEVFPKLFEKPVKRILDIGGNTGKFSMACSKYNKEVELCILDLPGQLAKAEKNIKAEGLADRIELFPINLLDHSRAYPSGFDIAWMSQFLDCFSQEDILQLLLKAKKALNPDGSIYILETLWDRQKYPASTYSLHATSLYFTCLANGSSQMYHSKDMSDLIVQAGLKITGEWDNIGIGHTLIECKTK